MPPLLRLAALLAIAGLLSAPTVTATPPPALAAALERLREQQSYSWEVINTDPGPVATEVETRRGTITTVQQNTSPHVRGWIDRQGDVRLVRTWSDGISLETVIAADGVQITRTPEGWMTDREILSAIADERVQAEGITPRLRWLRRADRPEIRRPDQELVPFLRSAGAFEATGDGYLVQARIRSDGTMLTDEEEGSPAATVAVTMNVQRGVVRDYEVRVEGRVTRARLSIPISDQRIVVITYLPVSRLDLPEAARAKLQDARAAARR